MSNFISLDLLKDDIRQRGSGCLDRVARSSSQRNENLPACGALFPGRNKDMASEREDTNSVEKWRCVSGQLSNLTLSSSSEAFGATM